MKKITKNYMRLYSIILIVAMIFSLAGCAGSDNPDVTTIGTEVTDPTEFTETEPIVTETVTEGIWGTVNVDMLAVYTEADTDSEYVWKLHIHTRVEVLETKDVNDVTWGYITWDHTETGWVDMKYITLDDEVHEEPEGTSNPDESTTPSTTTETKPQGQNTDSSTNGTTGTEPTETKHVHSYFVTDKKDAECCTDGYSVYTCACGSYYTKKIAARGYHNWGEWKTITAATTTSTGLMRRTCKDCGETEEKTIAKLVEPSTPAETKPAETNPPATEAPATEPAGCSHNWQSVYHPEVGHTEHGVVCNCGFRCKTTDEWSAHMNSYSATDALLYHGGYGSVSNYVVDTPAYTEWVCSKCGATTTTQP